MAATRDNVRAGTPLAFAGGLPARRTQLSDSPALPVEVMPNSAGVITERRARISGIAQPQYLGTQLDVSRIQNSLRAAERGDTWMLMTIFRDMISGYGHLQAEWAKRKLVITGQPESLIPYSDSPEDMEACEVIRESIRNCRNWRTALKNLLDGTLYPLAAAEKIYEEITPSTAGKFKYLKRYFLKEIANIDPILHCYKIPYIPNVGDKGPNPATRFDADQWESWLRFYSTNPQGNIIYSTADVYSADPNIHIVFRGNMLSETIPPNFGGHLRAILFCWLLATQDRDWWALFMQKYGMPFVMAKADTQQRDTVEFLNQQIQLAVQIGGLVIDKRAQAELVQANCTDGSNSHKMFTEHWHSETSKIVIGQTLSSKPEKTGMGSGAANQSEEIREDIRQSDTMNLSDCLKNQLFTQILEVNGYDTSIYHAPSCYWGGMRPQQAQVFGQTLNQLGAAGYELTDDGISTASHRLGYPIQRREMPTPNKLNSDVEEGSGKLIKY
jgi:Protein of unknown function (DUF935)